MENQRTLVQEQENPTTRALWYKSTFVQEQFYTRALSFRAIWPITVNCVEVDIFNPFLYSRISGIGDEFWQSSKISYMCKFDLSLTMNINKKYKNRRRYQWGLKFVHFSPSAIDKNLIYVKMSSLISENSLNIIVIDFLKLHVYEIFVRFSENLLHVKSPIPVIGLYFVSWVDDFFSVCE